MRVLHWRYLVHCLLFQEQHYIQQSKATATLTDMQEIGKAWEQYYLDTGSHMKALSNSATGIHHRYTLEYIESTVPGWKGPYLPYVKNTISAGVIVHPQFGNVQLVSAKDTQWGDDTNWYPDEICVSNNDCFLWVHITNVDENINKQIDILVDGVDNPKDGKFRYRQTRSYYKYAPLGLPVVE